MPAPYRQQPPETTRRVVAFSALLPATRVRLAEACNGGWPLRVLASQQRYLSRGVLGLLGAFPALLLLLLASSLGETPSRRAGLLLEDRVIELLLLAVLLAPLMLIFRACWHLHRGERLPFPPGVYLFARELVDARSEVLRLYSTGAINSIKKTGIFPKYKVSLRTGETFSFPAEIESSTEVEQRLLTLRERVEESESRGALATLDLHDPFFEERGRWDDLPPAPSPRGTLATLRWAALASCAVVLLPTVLLDATHLMMAFATNDRFALARIARFSTHFSAAADARWLSSAIEHKDRQSLLLYHAHGRQKHRAREALAVADGERCQDDQCWLDIYELCRTDKVADLALVERSLPYRRGRIEFPSCGQSAFHLPFYRETRDSSDPSKNSLAQVLLYCVQGLGEDTFARLDVKNAAMAPPLPGLLWSYDSSDYSAEVRQEARAALGGLYGEAKAALRGQEQTPWARAQGALFELLSSHDLDVNFTITHEVEGRPLITGLILPVEDLEEQLSAEVEQELKRRASPLLRLRYRARASELSPPSLTLRLVWSRSADLRSVELSRAAWVVGLPEQKTPLVFEGKPQTPPRWERRLGDGHFAKNQASLAGLLGQVF